ncbi:hypothetical protein H5410_026365 [Solanum commersonii]|uniref:Uncharacterized protein n=1 Tax=Solanum commersonii TaxID=4109 RepID=A0A9J5YWC2_SOLCO|nr:hypothetical protein H5410_026365 [Solanum commersonii]
MLDWWRAKTRRRDKWTRQGIRTKTGIRSRTSSSRRERRRLEKWIKDEDSKMLFERVKGVMRKMSRGIVNEPDKLLIEL